MSRRQGSQGPMAGTAVQSGLGYSTEAKSYASTVSGMSNPHDGSRFDTSDNSSNVGMYYLSSY